MWKFVGSLTNLKIVSYTGEYYLCYTNNHANFGTDLYLIKEEDDASPFKFESYKEKTSTNSSWRLKWLRDIRSSTYIYPNQRGRNTVTLYSLDDTDSDFSIAEVIIPTTVWTGTASSEWDNPTNWTDGVPYSSVNAFIPAGSTPIVSSTGANTADLF